MAEEAAEPEAPGCACSSGSDHGSPTQEDDAATAPTEDQSVADEERPSKLRRWVPVPHGQEAAPPGRGLPAARSFTVFSYNVLAVEYAGFQKHCKPEWLLWSHRRPAVIREIVGYAPDVGCLQEVDRFEPLRKALTSAGYDVLRHKRPYAPDSCVMYYRRDRFALEWSVQVNYDDIYSDKAVKRILGSPTIVRTGNVGIMAILADRLSGERVLVATAHWNWKYPEVKLMQAVFTARWIHRTCTRRGVKRFVLCGDLNSSPDTAAYHWLRHCSLPDSHPERPCFPLFDLTHTLKLRSAYEVLGEPETNFTPGYVGCLDYIWHSPGLLCSEVLEPFPRDGRFLPNREYPSDHVCIAARLHMV